MKKLFLVQAILCLTQILFSAEPFFAAPQKTGTMKVYLFPTEVVQSSDPVLVTFGVPFTRGSLAAADLAKIRVLKGTTEIAAHVEMLTPWRHTTNSAIDGQSVRVALVQFSIALSARYPKADSIVVEWGSTARTLDVATKEPPRSAWHLVTTGTFVAADSVYEPDVFAVLPKQTLCNGVLRFPQMEPFIDTISESRDNPSRMAPILHWPGNLEQMYAQKNFFYSIINQDDSRDTAICHYKTDCEPWLFDRSSSMYVLYLRSSYFVALREAVRAAGFYCNHLKSTGFFDFKEGDDAKYSYNECLAYTYWLTGDDRIAQKIGTVTKAFDGVKVRWTPAMNFWTERHCGFKLLAHVIAYEVLGGTYRDSMLNVFTDLAWLQNGADGQIPASRIDGGLYHYGAQHDWDWAEDTLGASPWMSVFVFDPTLRVYGCTEAEDAGKFLVRMAQFLKRSCIRTGYNNADEAKMDFPRYAVLFDGRDGQVDEWSDVQHAMEVGASIANGYYLSILLGTPDTSLQNTARSLYATYDDGVNGWIRPDAPASFMTAYRVAPWRKYNWEYRPSGAYSWALRQEVTGSAVKTDAVMSQNITVAARAIHSCISIDLYLTHQGLVKIALFSLNGKLIASAQNSIFTEGENRFIFRHGNVSSGCCVVKVAMQGSEYSQMVFIRTGQ